MSELSRDIQAVAADVATLRTEIERFRAELRTAFERLLEEHRSMTPRARSREQITDKRGAAPRR